MFLLPLALLLAYQEPVFRSEVSLVHVDVEVRANERNIEDLSKDDFKVSDGGKQQEILYFGHREESLDVLLLLDVSGSMARVVNRVAESANTALSELRAGDRVAVMTFAGKTELLLEFTEDFSAVERVIRDRLTRKEFGGSTLLQSGLNGAALFLQKQPRTNRRRTIIAVTDDISQLPDPRALSNLWEADAVATGLIVRDKLGSVLRFNVGHLVLGTGMGKIATRTGGDMLNSDDAGEGLREMIHRLRLRYSLYYATPKAEPGQERRIRVELTAGAKKTHKNAKVSARRGYVVPRLDGE